jgi:transcriptional regulator of arginine metabolism
MGLILDMKTNGPIIVIYTSPGSANLIARHLDRVRPTGILGTIAGDDTIFVAVASGKESKSVIREIEASFSA